MDLVEVDLGRENPFPKVYAFRDSLDEHYWLASESRKSRLRDILSRVPPFRSAFIILDGAATLTIPIMTTPIERLPHDGAFISGLTYSASALRFGPRGFYSYDSSGSIVRGARLNRITQSGSVLSETIADIISQMFFDELEERGEDLDDECSFARRRF